MKPYAVDAATSIGREHAEEEHPFRSIYTRDRDRVVHASAFRRLEAKTQVFGSNQNDYYRTRLTHTIEVAQITRTLSRSLGINEDAAEAVALSHDLGHPPFGHAGERALNGFLQEVNSEYIFNHNIQGLRIVTLLENKYPQFLGLNLSFEVREAFAKHGSGREFTPEIYRAQGELPCLEAQIADLSDAIAYNAHDIDDGLKSGLLIWEELATVPLIAMIVERFNLDYRQNPDLVRNELTRRIVNYFVSDALEATGAMVEARSPGTVDDIRGNATTLAALSAEAGRYIKGLREHLGTNLYEHPVVLRSATKATYMVQSLCKAFFADMDRLPRAWFGPHCRLPNQEDNAIRVVDYVSSLTDASAGSMYRELFDPSFSNGDISA